jgi:hypothetical protein
MVGISYFGCVNESGWDMAARVVVVFGWRAGWMGVQNREYFLNMLDECIWPI